MIYLSKQIDKSAWRPNIKPPAIDCDRMELNMKNERKIPKLPDAEMDVMLVLWSYDRPVKIIDIYNDLQSVRPCSKSAIHTLVDHLLQRGFIRIEMSPDRQSYKMITPIISQDEYMAAEADSFISRLCGGSWQKLIAAMVQSKNLSKDDMDEIAMMLDKKED